MYRFKSRDFIVVTVAFVLVVSAVLPLVSSSRAVSAASTGSSCTSANTFNEVIGGGTPNTFKPPGARVAASSVTFGLTQIKVGPETMVNGTVYYFDSIANSVTSNANYTQWTYHINPDRYWSNGQQITAQDFLNTYTSSYALSPSADVANLRLEITSVVAVNSSTVVFNLNQSDAQFEVELNNNQEVPPQPPSVIAQGIDSLEFTGAVTDGPFVQQNYTVGSTQAVLVRNPYFSPLPGICEIIMSYAASTSDIPTLMISGQYDFAPVDNVAVSGILADNSALKAELIPGISDLMLGYDIQTYPYNMTAFRQALAYSIDENDIVVTAYGGLGVTAYNSEGTVPPSSGWYSPNQEAYSYNLTKAVSLLHSIGFTGGTNGATLKYPNGTAVALTEYTSNGNTGAILAGQIIATDLSGIGMSINDITSPTNTITGYVNANTPGILAAMFVQWNAAQTPGIAYNDAEAGWVQGYDSITGVLPYWLPPGEPTNEFNSNVSALKATDNPTLEKQYVDNTQALDADYLPIIMLCYPSYGYIYNSAAFTFPDFLSLQQATPSMTAFAMIQPAGASSTTAASSSLSPTSSIATTSSSITSSVPTTTSIATTSTIPTTTTSQAVTTSSSSSSSISFNASYFLLIATAVIVLLAVSLGFVFVRKRSSIA